MHGPNSWQSNKENAAMVYHLSVALMLAVFLLLVVLSWAGVTYHAEAALANLLPSWLVWTNLLLIPFFCALAAGSFRIPLLLRSMFLALTLCSIVIFEIGFRRYPGPSAAALVLFLLEVYWIIPKWNLRHTT